MTAPMIPANGGNGEAPSLLDMDDNALAESLGLEKTGVTETDIPRGADGKFVAKTAEKPAEVPVTEAPIGVPEDEKPAVDSAEAPGVPEPVAEDKPAEPVKPPLTKFQAVDDKGAPVELPNAILKYKVDGKVVENDIVKTVHLAQQSTYNARQVQDLTERNTAGDAQLREVMQTNQQYEASIAQMFADPNVYERAKALYFQANSPEKVAEAAKAEVAQVKEQYNQQQEQAAVAQYVAGTIEPALHELVKEYPSVTLEDLAGQIALASGPLLRNGKVPYTDLPKLSHWVNTGLSDWAEAAHAKRTEASRTASKSLDKERAATQAKQREMGKALAPVGSQAAAPPKAPPITRARDVMNDPIFNTGS